MDTMTPSFTLQFDSFLHALGERRNWLRQKYSKSAKHSRDTAHGHRNNISFAHSVRRPSRLCSRCVGELALRARLGTVMEYCRSQSQATRSFSYKRFKRMTQRGSEAHSLAQGVGCKVQNQPHMQTMARPMNQFEQQAVQRYTPHAIAGVHQRLHHVLGHWTCTQTQIECMRTY